MFKKYGYLIVRSLGAKLQEFSQREIPRTHLSASFVLLSERKLQSFGPARSGKGRLYSPGCQEAELIPSLTLLHHFRVYIVYILLIVLMLRV